MKEDEVNALEGVLKPHEWSKLRGLFNDWRFKQVEGELSLLYSNHIPHINQSFENIAKELKKLGVDVEVGVKDENA